MASNYYSCGKALDHTNAGASTIPSGSAVLLGTVLGVALVDIAVGATGSVAVEGVWKLARTSGQTYAIGAALYWDDTAKAITTTASGNTKVGYAAVASSASTTLAFVKLSV